MTRQINYEKDLNSSQLEAVFFKEGPLLVIAGAGSGKTRTLIYRVARLVEEGVSPASILLLTFTRKAALEMLTRASLLLDNRCGKVPGGTFHSFANHILRKYATNVGFKEGFTILDRPDSENLVGVIKKDLNIKTRQSKFPKNRTLVNIFSKSINKGISVEDTIYDDFPHFSIHLETIVLLNQSYNEQKRKHHFMDFDDLLVYLHDLLKNQPEIRSKIASNFIYVLADEYQDTNWLQAEILHLLTGENKNVMAVGDDSQSIYAFRGANFRNIMDFPEIFPDTKIISLEENYRSVQPILNLTNTIIDRATDKYEKKLFTRKKGGSKPLLIDTGDENSQSRFVVEKILDFHESGIPLKQIAVLFRASFHSFDLEIELSHANIPFVKVGGFKFAEASHIKDVLAHLRVILNPQDRISWYRILLLLKKIGPKTAQSLYEMIVSENSGFHGICEIKHKAGMSPDMIRLKDFFSTLDPSGMTVLELGQAVIHYYTPILRDKFDDHPKRMKDLEQLLSIMERYNDLQTFLTNMALEPPNNSMEQTLVDRSSQDDYLVLSTIHSAKGLEWKTVFLIWALDGRFPSIHSINRDDELEEELRLMYVAATRAKENLFFTYPSETYDRATGMPLYRPSRFIDGISDEVLKKTHYQPW